VELRYQFVLVTEFYLDDKSKGMRWVGHLTHMGDDKYIQNVVGRSEEERSCRLKLKDNIKMFVK
jgi:hypothetical protein